MTLVFLIILALAAGFAAACQGAANAGLAARTGLSVALVINTALVLIGGIAFWIQQGAPRTFFPKDTPAHLYAGGLCGFIIIASMAFAFPRLGGGLAISLMVLGQGCAALAIDHFGLFGMPHRELNAMRLLGIAFLVLGAFLVARPA